MFKTVQSDSLQYPIFKGIRFINLKWIYLDKDIVIYP
jgi:hypothetical protein